MTKKLQTHQKHWIVKLPSTSILSQPGCQWRSSSHNCICILPAKRAHRVLHHSMVWGSQCLAGWIAPGAGANTCETVGKPLRQCPHLVLRGMDVHPQELELPVGMCSSIFPTLFMKTTYTRPMDNLKNRAAEVLNFVQNHSYIYTLVTIKVKQSS